MENAMRRWMIAICFVSMLVGCGSDPVDPAPDPQAPGEEEGEAVDYCEVFGWYGDGNCDDVCPNPDPDCESEPSTPGTPGTPPTPVEPTEPECEANVGWQRDYVFYGSCDSVSEEALECQDGWVPFEDECGCGCEEAQNSQPTPVEPDCDHLEAQGEVVYMSEDPDACETLRFTCSDDEIEFSDEECGCGCIRPWDTTAQCLDDSTSDIDRVGNTEECMLIDFACTEGWVAFEDDCGCGCRLSCSDDFECPNGYCGPETACGTDAPCPRYCVYPDCGDGTELTCMNPRPDCYDGDVAAVVNGCWECLDARTCGPSNGL